MNLFNIKKLIKAICIIFFLILFPSCTILELQGPGNKTIIMANHAKNCKTIASDTNWHFFIGTFPLSQPDFSSVKTNEKNSYRYVEHSNWLDIVVNVSIGYLTTITRTSVDLQECPSESIVYTQEKLDHERQVILDTLLKSNKQPVFVLKNDTRLQGKLVEITEKNLNIEMFQQVDAKETSKSQKPAKIGDIVTQRNGMVLKGNIIAQTRSSVTLKTNKKRLILQKTTIKRIRMSVPLTRPKTIRKVTKIIQRSEIRRIILK